MTILVSINGTIGNVALYDGEKVVLGKSACYFNVLNGVDRHVVRYVVASELFQKLHSQFSNWLNDQKCLSKVDERLRVLATAL